MSHQAKQLIAQAKAEKWTRLDLEKFGLTHLSTQVPELFELTHLEELVLSNEWTEWNEEENKWERKESQNIGEGNKLNELPQAMGRLACGRIDFVKDLGVGLRRCNHRPVAYQVYEPRRGGGFRINGNHRLSPYPGF